MSRSALIYTGLALCAIAVVGFVALRDPAAPLPATLENKAELDGLRQGSMKKLAFHGAPKPVPDVAFETVEGSEARLSAYKGRYVVLNFWATWCGPCRKEMPALSQLETEFGGDDFAVVTIAVGRNPVPAMKKFFGEIEVTNLPLHRDPKQGLARQMGVLGLPVTVILSPEGHEIARMTGDADWHSDSAKAIIRALLKK